MLFVFYGQKDLVQMPFTLRCIKCFTRPAVHVWCEKFARGGENVEEY